jgi:hypothetical protein
MRRWIVATGVALAMGCGEEPTPFTQDGSIAEGSVTRDAGFGPAEDARAVPDATVSDMDASASPEAGPPPRRDGGTGPEGGSMMMVPATDADGDGISDEDEGRAMNLDTDRDGTPDYLDDDSDGDGIADRVEAGDMDLASRPRDTDRDGTPDVRDLDSDGNGWPDRAEGAGDRDMDGEADFVDVDNDGDFIDDTDEVGPMPLSPRDTDRDMVPDLNELDSDGDFILDAEENGPDTDRDMTIDRLDADSDNDGWTDLEEAGDRDLMTPAVDTDRDGIADYRDPDSDGDGLSDRLERMSMTSRTSADTDGDGVSDLIEVGAGTRPTDPMDSPRTRGNFVFVVPYMMPPMPPRDTLQFSTTLRRADVYFLMDTTGSMGGEITNLQSGINGTLVPQIRMRIPEAWMGVGRYDDYPLTPFGGPADRPFTHLQDVTMDDAVVRAAVGRLALGSGNDTPESSLQAMWAVGTGNALTWPTGMVPARTGCPVGRTGYPCFRPDAVPIIVNFTDAPMHNGPGGANPYSFAAPNFATVSADLAARRVRVMTVESGGGVGRPHAEAIANATMATDAGSPLVYTISGTGTGLSSAVVTGIEALARQPLDVSVRGRDLVDMGETVDAMAAFVSHLETRTMPAPGRMCTLTYPTRDYPGIDADAFPDTFIGVRGEPVCFDIVAKTNMTVRPTLVPQLFRAQVEVIGNGFTPLDARIVYFLVPPTVPDPN